MQTRASSKTPKVFDLLTTQVLAIDASANVLPLNEIPLGNADGQRVGRRVDVRTIEFNYAQNISTAFAVTGGRQRAIAHFCLVYDRNTNGQVLAYTDVFTAAGPLAFVRRDVADRFVVLREWIGSFRNAGAYDGQEFDRECVKLEVDLEATYGTFGLTANRPITGGLFLCYVSQAASAGSAQVLLQYRIVYTD